MPETDISVTITACHVLTSPPLQIRTTASGRRGVGRLEGPGPQLGPQPAASRTNAKAELRVIGSSRTCLTDRASAAAASAPAVQALVRPLRSAKTSKYHLTAER